MKRETEPATRKVVVPRSALVLLVGVSGSGKSTFAERNFGASQVVSSDRCRWLVCDDEADQSATSDAFEILHHIVGKRLERGRLTVVDATNVESYGRKRLISLSREHRRPVVAIVLEVDESVALEQNQQRANRRVPPAVVRQQLQELAASKREIAREGFQRVHVLKGRVEVGTAVVAVE